MELRVTISGVPQPKGSMKSVGNGRMIEDGTPDRRDKKTGKIKRGSAWMKRQWRTTIVRAVGDAMATHPYTCWPLKEAVRIDTIFYLPIARTRLTGKRALIPGTRHAYKPDRDKLHRAIGDALKDALLVEDDCLDAEGYGRKEWCLPGSERAEVVITW